jgi:hypothetical protein
MLLVNLSTQSTSVVTLFARDSRPGPNPYTTSPSVLEGRIEKPFRPTLLGAGESKEFDVVYREFIPRECGFAELNAASTNLVNWDKVMEIFAFHKRTFPFCDPYPNKPASILHEHIIFTIVTARGQRQVATSHEIVKFDNEGRHGVTIFTPDVN